MAISGAVGDVNDVSEGCAGRSVRGAFYVGLVMDDADVDGMRRGFVARRVRMPSSGVESWTVVGPDARPVGLIDEFLGWLTGIERSPNTVEAYARDAVFLSSRQNGRIFQPNAEGCEGPGC